MPNNETANASNNLAADSKPVDEAQTAPLRWSIQVWMIVGRVYGELDQHAPVRGLGHDIDSNLCVGNDHWTAGSERRRHGTVMASGVSVTCRHNHYRDSKSQWTNWWWPAKDLANLTPEVMVNAIVTKSAQRRED